MCPSAALVRDELGLVEEAVNGFLRLAELEKENALLTAIRQQTFGGDEIGVRGRLIPARAITAGVSSAGG